LAHIPRHIPKPSHQCGNVQEGPGGGGSGLWGISSLWPYMHTICTASGAEDEEEDLFDKYSDMEDAPVDTRGVLQIHHPSPPPMEPVTRARKEVGQGSVLLGLFSVGFSLSLSLSLSLESPRRCQPCTMSTKRKGGKQSIWMGRC
jgi:hypothetical protein